VKKVLGYNPDDLLGLPFRSLIHPDDVHVIDDAQQSHRVEGSQTTVEESRFRNASGEWRWLLSTGVPMREQNKNMFNFIGIARDITVQKKIEADLKASEQNFRNSIDCSSMGIRIMGDHDRILYANQALLDIFGYENIEEMRVSPPQEHYTPESYAGFIQRKEQFARGESLANQLEFDIIRKDGAIRHIQLSSMKILWNGKEQGQTVYNDITERKQAERKLEAASREWRTTFDSITDLISIQDKNNRIIRVNKALADLLQTTPQELIGKSCREVMRSDQECPANCPHLRALKTGKPSSIEIFNSKLGVHFQESASPLVNEKGEVTGSVLVTRDVTQQKRMEEQLIMTDRLASIGELSSGIAHELNNPLTSVIGFSQMLMEGDVPANMKEDLATVYSEALRAAAIVKNLLTFARKHAPVKQLSQINTVVEDVLRLRAYEQKVNNIKLENHFAPDLPQIMMDHFQIQQVFLNIIVNAEFAMTEAHNKGNLTITTEKVDDFIRVTFTDDGPGISKENLKHIFDPFFTTKDVGKGTGLGLSICHGIVTEHGGKIYARSEKDQGTIFVVDLPLLEN
jgi:PAS domain S-box-containing protein